MRPRPRPTSTSKPGMYLIIIRRCNNLMHAVLVYSLRGFAFNARPSLLSLFSLALGPEQTHTFPFTSAEMKNFIAGSTPPLL